MGQTDGVCSNPDKRFCNQQVHNMMPWEAKTRQLAIEKVIAKGAWTETQCKDCFNDFGQTPCSPQDGIFDSKCSWERLAPMKALWVPSLKDITHYQPTKEYFAKAGIKTHGFVQWADSGGGSAHGQ